MCPTGPSSSCAQQDLPSPSDLLGSQFPFGEGARCSQPFPSHPVIPAVWLRTVGTGRMPVGAFLQVDKTHCVVVWCGVTHCVGLCMFLCREQDLQRSHPRLLQHAWTHTHTCVPFVNLCGGSRCSFLVLLQQMADFSVGYLYPRLIFRSVLLLSVNMFQVRKA